MMLNEKDVGSVKARLSPALLFEKFLLRKIIR